MQEASSLAQACGSLREELAATHGTGQLRALGARLSALGSAVALACERAYLELV